MSDKQYESGWENDPATQTWRPPSVARSSTPTLTASDFLPAGIIAPYAGTTAPSGWLLCDGSSFSGTTYPQLAALLGGTTTPNLKGKVVVGRDAAQAEFDVMQETGGAKTHTLTISEFPSHDHGTDTTDVDTSHDHAGFTTAPDGTHTHSYNADDNGGGNVALNSTAPTSNYAFLSRSLTTGTSGSTHTHGIATQIQSHDHNIDLQGGGTAHNNLQPYMVLNYIIKAA